LGPEKIYLINIGDSRAIIISNDGHVLAYTEGYFLLSICIAFIEYN